MVNIVIEAEGHGAEAALNLAADFFAGEFGVKAAPHAVAPGDTQRGLGPEWWAVIIGLPGAVIATMDLAARLKLIERTAAMLEALRAKLGTAGGVIRIGARVSFDVATAKAREIVDALTEEDEDGGGRG